MTLKKITAADFNTAIKKLTTSDASVWWKTLGETEDGTKLCFVMGWNDGYDEDEDGTMYQQDGYTLCTKIGYKPSNLMVMDYTDFNMPYDKKTAEVWDTDMSVGKGEYTNDAFDVKWYNDEAEAIWKKYGKPNRDGLTALDLMESKKSEAKKHTCSMEKKKESLAKKCEEYIPNVRERLWSFIDAGFITTEEIGDYLLRALSVDTLEKVYEWLVQDEMIPSEETLADEHQLKFCDDGEFVSIDTDDSTESKNS